MNKEQLSRYVHNNVDSIVLRDIENSELGAIGGIITPSRLAEEVKFYHKKYKDEIISFLRGGWKWHETGEDVTIDEDFIEIHLQLNISMDQLIKKLQDVRTPFSFMNDIHEKTAGSSEFLPF